MKKDFYKNPIFYYIAIPVIIALWPLILWASSIPAAEERFTDIQKEYDKSQGIIAKILPLDDFAQSEDAAEEFDYARALNSITQLCNISSSNYRLSTRNIISSGSQKTQDARVTLTDLDITRFARFLSMLQFRWPSLNCQRIVLTKKDSQPDLWDFDIDLKYYY